jgi:hypothetical protein
LVYYEEYSDIRNAIAREKTTEKLEKGLQRGADKKTKSGIKGLIC